MAWIVSVDGFVSVVAARDDKGVLIARARDRKTLELLLGRAAKFYDALSLGREVARREGRPVRPAPREPVIEESGTADYRFRARLPRRVLREVVAEVVDQIGYQNVKDEVTRSRGVRYGSVMNDAWVLFRRLQEPEPFRRSAPRGQGRK